MDQVGYARVSTREKRQVFDCQIDALRAAGCHRIFDNRGSRSDPLCPYRKFSHGCCQRAHQGHRQVVVSGPREGHVGMEFKLWQQPR